MRVGLYPGSFDPVTNGHIDIIQRSLRMFDKLIIGIGVHNKKVPLFTLEERRELIYESLGPETRFMAGFEVIPFQNLVVEFAEDVGAEFIIRGLRNNTDFEYEFAFAHLNTRINPRIEHIFLMSGEPDHFVSSSAVKELWSFGTNYCTMVPEPVFRALENKRRIK